MNPCRITVIKKLYHNELVNEYCSLDLPENCTGCPRFSVGDEFLVKNHTDVPENFCSWAWADIQKDVMAVMAGGAFPWIKQDGVAITCCTDGLMPVVFKVEQDA